MVAVAVVGAVLCLCLYLREKADPLSRGYREIADQHEMRLHQVSMEILYRPSEKARLMPMPPIMRPWSKSIVAPPDTRSSLSPPTRPSPSESSSPPGYVAFVGSVSV